MGYKTDFQVFVEANGLKKKDLASHLGVSATFISQLCNGQSKLPDEKLKQIKATEGWDTSMFSTEQSNLNFGNSITTGDINGNGNNIAGGMVVQTAQPQEVESVVVEEVPYLARPVIESRTTNLREYVESEDVKTIIPQGLICTGIDFARKIYSDAMAPDIREGDIILCNFVPDASNLVDGDTYVVETSTYGCVMRDVKHDGDEIILMARNGRSPDLRVKPNDIKSVAVPIQLIRSTFSQRTDFSKIIREKDERIGLLVEREFDHIRHTDKLLEQIDRVTSQQGKLIEALVGRV